MSFRTSTISRQEADKQLDALRSRTGDSRRGRPSKYAGISKKATLLTDDTVLRVSIPKKQLQSLKAYLLKQHGRVFTVKTVSKGPDDVTAFIFRQEPPKRKRTK